MTGKIIWVERFLHLSNVCQTRYATWSSSSSKWQTAIALYKISFRCFCFGQGICVGSQNVPGSSAGIPWMQARVSERCLYFAGLCKSELTLRQQMYVLYSVCMFIMSMIVTAASNWTSQHIMMRWRKTNTNWTWSLVLCLDTEPEAPHVTWPMRPKWTSSDWQITSRSIMERMVMEFAICANSLE